MLLFVYLLEKSNERVTNLKIFSVFLTYSKTHFIWHDLTQEEVPRGSNFIQLMIILIICQEPEGRVIWNLSSEIFSKRNVLYSRTKMLKEILFISKLSSFIWKTWNFSSFGISKTYCFWFFIKKQHFREKNFFYFLWKCSWKILTIFQTILSERQM